MKKNILVLVFLSLSFGFSMAQSADELFAKAEEAYNSGKEAEALPLLEKILKIQPKYTKAYVIQGHIYRNSKKYPEALKAYNKAIELEPKNQDSYTDLADTKLLMGDYKGAIPHCDKSLSINANNESAIAAYDRRADANLFLKNGKAALKDQEMALKIATTKGSIFESFWLSKIASTKTEYLQDYQGAIKDYDRIIALENKAGNTSAEATAYYSRGLLKRDNLKQKAEGCADLEKAAALDSGPNAYQEELTKCQ